MWLRINKSIGQLFMIVLLFTSMSMAAQQLTNLQEADSKTKKFFEAGQKLALEKKIGAAKVQYRNALKRSPGLEVALTELAGIYVTENNMDSSIYFLNKIIEINPKPSARIYYTLASLYYNDEKYATALPFLMSYMASDAKSAKSIATATRMIENCHFAIEAMKKPRIFEPHKLPPTINTDAPEYLPSLSADGQLLIFSRIINRQEDLYYSFYDSSGWSLAQPMSSLNTERYNEAGHCISADGKTIVFTGCNIPGGLGSCDLYISYLRNNQWTRPQNMGAPVNSPGWESQPSISADGNTLYFASERPGGYGLRDIWYTEKGPGGGWSTPQNMGLPINTTSNEGAPFIHADNNTLYFMSEGFPGMGGSDLYLTRRIINDQWSIPENLGYPINTIGNEGALVVSLDGTTAYYTSTGQSTSTTQDGIEATDLYYFEMDEAIRPQPVSYFKAQLADATTMKAVQGHVHITGLVNGTTFYSNYTADDGTILVCIPGGEYYGIQLSSPGYIFISESIHLPDSANIGQPHVQTYWLTKIEDAADSTYLMKNIFFESGSAALIEASDAEINALVTLLHNNPSIRIQIDGHTDNVGSEKDNQELSQQRAQSVVKAIINKGIAASRLTAIGHGELNPIADNSTEEGRSQNRRTEFRILL